MKAARRILWLATIGGLLTVCGSGCRLFQKKESGDGGAWSGIRDPLMGRDRIPATSLPTGKENAGGKRDPLLGKMTGDGERTSSDLPPSGSRKEPFRLTPDTTVAGLTNGKNSDPLLSVPTEEPDRRTNGNPTARTAVPLQGVSYEDRIADLKRYGVKVSEAIREGNEYILRGELEFADHVRRRFEGAGASPTAAAADLLDQVRSERKE